MPSKPRAALLIIATTVAIMFSPATRIGHAALAKSGTIGGYAENSGLQAIQISALTTPGSFQAERLKVGDHTTPPWDDISLTNLRTGSSCLCAFRHPRTSLPTSVEQRARTKTLAQKLPISIQP
jgi:hypothetical protein